MNFTITDIIEATVIALSISLDAFTAGFAYGSRSIRIPMCSIQIISIISSSITGLALLFGSIMAPFIPKWLTVGIAFLVLFFIGFSKLLDSFTKAIIRKHSDISKKIKISMFNFKFILYLYANPEEADADNSQTISPLEAIALAISLSLDGIAVGFGAALINVNTWYVIICSLATNTAALMIGRYAGEKIAARTNLNIAWISGVTLIGLAFSKLF